MPRIAPIAWEDLTDEARTRIEAGVATGMYRMTLPLQIVAHSPNALRGMDEGYKAVFGCSSVGSRTQELMRLRSAQVGACGPCSVTTDARSTGTVSFFTASSAFTFSS